ncbi:hypothetical protein [Streptomyces sp. BP-8]|uniref:Uncharacterized protein n=1 Tax=Streptomyces sirii TaxID=3127701 RepID=A0ABZ2QUF3_9ACTN
MAPNDSVRTGGVPELVLWFDQVPDAIDRLKEDHLPEAEWLDFSVDSLPRLEDALLDHGDADEPTGFVDDAMAYLGEVLMGVGGGAWGWDTESAGDAGGQPAIVPDAALEADPILPMLLIADALNVSSGSVFTEAVASLSAAVEAVRTHDPQFTPAKEHTPGVDPDPEVPRYPWLSGWLNEREKTFAVWVEETGLPAQTWDFSPASLDVLERLVRERFPAKEEFEEAEAGLFLQGASWYVGEVARRERDAAWHYLDPEEHDTHWAGDPLMNQPGIRDGNLASPMSELYAAAVLDRDGVVLRERLDWYAES